MSAVDALVASLPRTTFVVGKGGVGKTTCAGALALRARRSGKTLVVSTDPARALPLVLEQPVDANPTPVKSVADLEAQVLDASVIRLRFMQRWGDVVRLILDRGTYLDKSDIDPLVDAALPGGDEIFSALALAELIRDDRAYAHVIVDTAPTGHTLRLFNLPKTFLALVRLLTAMQDKHRFMVRTLTHGYRADDADAFLAEMTTLVSTLDDALRDPQRCAAIMVANTQPLVVAESKRYLDALRELGLYVAALVWNGSSAAQPTLDVGLQLVVPRLETWPVGRTGLGRWLDAIRPLPAAPRGRAAHSTHPESEAVRGTRHVKRKAGSPAALEVLVRPLTIVAGKGGVGKTTVAATLALAAANRRTLVVSTDPAPSLADALAQPIPDLDTQLQDSENLWARQMDASAAFVRLRGEYESRVDALFDALVAKGVDMAHDRAIARDLLSLAPPGVDEVYALSLLSDALFKNRYECVMVDPAPTGHLLRLLEMPQVALGWTHQLLRLMLKYKDVTGLGESARELLDFSRDVRAVDALLRDHVRAAVVLVTLNEPVVLAETERLASEVVKRDVSIAGVVLNRSTHASALPVPFAPVHFEAPVVEPPPVGVDALRAWARVWSRIEE